MKQGVTIIGHNPTGHRAVSGLATTAPVTSLAHLASNKQMETTSYNTSF